MGSVANELLKDGRRLLLAIPATALVLCLVGLYATRGSMANLSFLTTQNGGLVDQRPWQTIQQLAPLAVSTEEQNYAQEAERLADHEVDQAFAMALREANTQPKILTPEAQTLTQKIAALQITVKADQTHVDALTASEKAANSSALQSSDDLEVAKTQLQLDSDELNDANESLAIAVGDKRGEIQQELAAREAALKKTATTGGGQIALLSAKSRGTLASRISAWFDQRSRYSLLLEAKRQADSDAAKLNAQHASVETQANAAAAAASVSLQTAPVPGPPTQSSPATPAASDATAKPLGRSARLQMLRSLSEEHSILDDRLQTQQQLSVVYGKWAAQVERQHKIVLHLMLRSFALIAFIVFSALLAVAVVEMLIDRAIADVRRSHTMRTIATLAVEVAALLLILLVIFGPPSQVPTILGLATAGITVVFQDFILAFFGWFVLMGRNGIRVGDRVEINAVGGEVVEIGLFRTTLMETGNWTDKGHPTGRKVTFINNFAITGQFFNFSTAGQWMWDELVVGVPAAEATYETIQAIRERVISDTREDTQLAMAEWQRSTTQKTLTGYAASPSVDLRPSAAGIDIIVRYVTRASCRFEMRNTIYQAMIEILRLRPEALPAPKN